ncbi:chemotaxis protein CheB [Treponema bryantii]|uniref:chemotaxis protein CheB n=1 Tax=Treponema bryantii TaxID=163 RepID=UPI000402C3D9|nr:chemotaxis protein CheB [Treponema bryantii]
MSDLLKVLIVDDSAITRGLFEKAFVRNNFEIAASVSNGRKAVDFCRDHNVDVVVSDYNMPEMDGIEAAKLLIGELGIPVLIYSEDPAIKTDVLATGAAFEKKPSLQSFDEIVFRDFTIKVRKAVDKAKSEGLSSHVNRSERNVESDTDIDSLLGERASFKVLCIGASTGGPTAVQEVLTGLGNNFPLPVLYTQHIDIGADEKMVRWFNQVCPNIPMSLARDGEIAKKGHVYMAPADKHLVIDYVKNDLPVLKLSDEPPERFLRPAVNKLFRSAARIYKNTCIALLLTGMGQDGAEGCKEIIKAGGFTICEDESTCTVFGMPQAAIEMKAASRVLPRDCIARAVVKMTR